ncbi:hypothetical protein JXO52_07530 [bacterium]|nr:hypothetical protein [bacterium]
MDRLPSVIAIACTLFFAQSLWPQTELVPRDSLIADVRELVNLIERVHPDPYILGGGKVAFHRRLHHTLRSIPDSGMTLQDFYWHLQPLVNGVGDGHTFLQNTFWRYDPDAADGIPFWFSVTADKQFFVSGVTHERYRSYLGAALVSVQGHSLADLVEMTRILMPCQNDYDALWKLNAMLFEMDLIHHLIPELHQSDSLEFVFTTPGGERAAMEFSFSEKRHKPMIRPEKARLDLPSTGESDFVYSFLDDAKKTAFLRIDNQEAFREIIEYAISTGFDSETIVNFARPMYERVNSGPVPQDLDSIMAGIPSITHVFKSLVAEMAEAGTKHLIVDLSRNNGGQSVLSQVLVYFLYGKETLEKLYTESYTIDKYSDVYFSIFQQYDFEEICRGFTEKYGYPLQKNDFNFSGEDGWLQMKMKQLPSDSLSRRLELELMPFATFYEEYGKKDNSYYTPERVLVLCSERTYSAGFGTLADLYKCGAEIVGVPSGQSGNCFGNAPYVTLSRTGLSGFVATNYIVMFADDEESGRVLMPHFPLTYETWREYGFDPGALYRYAVDLIEN